MANRRNTPAEAAEQAAVVRARDRTRKRAQAAADYDIADQFKNNADTARRAKAEKSLRAWCETYLADRFKLRPWATYHKELFKAFENMLQQGGHQAVAAPRGGGKSAIAEAAIMYGALTGRTNYAVLLTATANLAPKSLSSIKTELQGNDLLLQDYEYLIRPLHIVGGGTVQRCRSMLLNGKNIWPQGGDPPINQYRLVLPQVPSEAGSGAVMECAGLLEAVRGIKYAKAGDIMRPQLALIDDPQTQRSAKSPKQCADRMHAIMAGISRLGGPTRDISMLLALTVIEEGDLADELLDRSKHPEFHGIRTSWFNAWPKGCNPRIPDDRASSDDARETAKTWDAYMDIHREELGAGKRRFPASRKFYNAHRDILDRGAEVSWPARKLGCVSAIEYGMRKFMLEPESFLAEMQNDPGLPQDTSATVVCSTQYLLNRTNGLPRYEVPLNAEKGTFFIDCHQRLLYYAVAFWGKGLTGGIVDYGTWPDQGSSFFELHHCRKPMSADSRVDAMSDEGKLTQALHHLLKELTQRRWLNGAGVEVDLELGLVDAGWKTDTVFEVCANAKRQYGVKVIPAIGTAFGPTKTPMSHWNRKTTKGLLGDNWHFAPPGRNRPCRHVLHDANRRKMSMWRCLNIPLGDAGALALFHAEPGKHRMVVEHLTSEVASRFKSNWGELVMFKLPPNRENHYLDCVSGVVTAAQMLGFRPPVIGTTAPPPVELGGAYEDGAEDAEPAPTAPVKKRTKQPRKRVTYMNI